MTTNIERVLAFSCKIKLKLCIHICSIVLSAGVGHVADQVLAEDSSSGVEGYVALRTVTVTCTNKSGTVMHLGMLFLSSRYVCQQGSLAIHAKSCTLLVLLCCRSFMTHNMVQFCQAIVTMRHLVLTCRLATYCSTYRQQVDNRLHAFHFNQCC